MSGTVKRMDGALFPSQSPRFRLTSVSYRLTGALSRPEAKLQVDLGFLRADQRNQLLMNNEDISTDIYDYKIFRYSIITLV
jgi:hypothetical protein